MALATKNWCFLKKYNTRDTLTTNHIPHATIFNFLLQTSKSSLNWIKIANFKFIMLQLCHLIIFGTLLILNEAYIMGRMGLSSRMSKNTEMRSRSKSSILLKAKTSSSSSLDSEPLLRMGHGYDIHRLKEGGKLVIAGVEIPYELGADAHSDGDAVYHSIVDAILGALSTNKDIGMLFPDNDPQWKGADSSIFMNEAVKIMNERGYRIGNVDVTLILQKPKVKDFKQGMKDNIVRLLETVQDRVNVKARTHEKVDSVGECRSYECHVVVVLEKCQKTIKK